MRIVKKTILYFVLFIAVSFGVWVIFLVRGGRDPAILMYHSVGEQTRQKSTLDISEEAFEKQMAFLYRHRYRVIPLLEAAGLLRDKKRIPSKTVVITFDDGYENTYTKAFPVLEKYNFPATVFLIVNLLGRQKELDGRDVAFMTAEMARRMSDTGLITFGSHTANHAYLPGAEDESTLAKEIAGSKAALEEILGKPVHAFCYPLGGYTRRIQRHVRSAGYKAAVTTLPGHQGYAARDIFALKRIKMTERSSHPFVFFIQTSGYYVRMKEINSPRCILAECKKRGSLKEMGS